MMVLRRNSKRRSKVELVPYNADRVYDGYERGGLGSPGSPPLTGMSERSKMTGGGGDAYPAQTLPQYYGYNGGEANRHRDNNAYPSQNAPRKFPSSGALQ